jgi:hypothetical protein
MRRALIRFRVARVIVSIRVHDSPWAASRRWVDGSGMQLLHSVECSFCIRGQRVWAAFEARLSSCVVLAGHGASRGGRQRQQVDPQPLCHDVRRRVERVLVNKAAHARGTNVPACAVSSDTATVCPRFMPGRSSQMLVS